MSEVQHVRKADSIEQWVADAAEEIRVARLKERVGLKHYREAGRIWAKIRKWCKVNRTNWGDCVRKAGLTEPTINGWISIHVDWDLVSKAGNLAEALKILAKKRREEKAEENGQAEKDEEGDDESEDEEQEQEDRRSKGDAFSEALLGIDEVAEALKEMKAKEMYKKLVKVRHLLEKWILKIGG